MKIIVVDFDKVCSLIELHKVLKDAFDLPDYYGNNMDALWDCLNCYFDSPVLIELKSISKISKTLSDSMQIMLKVFEDLERENDEITVKIINE